MKLFNYEAFVSVVEIKGQAVERAVVVRLRVCNQISLTLSYCRTSRQLFWKTRGDMNRAKMTSEGQHNANVED